MFASAMPEWLMEKMGKIYVGKPLKTKTRKELLATIKPHQWKYLREDNGDLPDGWHEQVKERQFARALPVLS